MRECALLVTSADFISTTRRLLYPTKMTFCVCVFFGGFNREKITIRADFLKCLDLRKRAKTAVIATSLQ
ncbi:MAG: hypothetical protein KatS3mg099_185 [Candidatus Parcubacteria bacterium]|nr:MAG: hypothetical protein KatS3mg099_185 [Candidatus Parcubacteria bacterium]